MITLKNPGQVSATREGVGGFCNDTIERARPGAFNMSTKHPIYVRWAMAKRRCCNVSHEAYKNYGGRGITMCEEWKNNFTSFANYVMKLPNALKAGYSIDRIDNDKGYEPGNLRWADRKTQAINRRGRVCGKYIGIHRQYKLYQSIITVDRRRIFLGSYKTIKEALSVRNQYIIDNNLTNYKIQVYGKPPSN